MRQLVVCPQCCRRYDVTGRRPGARFHCLCGETLTVEAPRGHDAAVVRCSSCGAPREKQQPACGSCGSDFTLHERDLHTVCPSCLARVSDKGKYCHYCAAPLIADKLPDEKQEVRCPACSRKPRLNSRRFAGFPVATLECPLCAGLWLGLEALEEVLAMEARGVRPHVRRCEGEQGDEPNQRRGYIACLVCGELMSRRNLAQGKSGVVVDVCGHHGVWFDATELAQLIGWVRLGGLEEVRSDLARLVGSQDVARKRRLDARQKETRSQVSSNRSPSSNQSPFTGESDRDASWLVFAGEIALDLLLRRRL